LRRMGYARFAFVEQAVEGEQIHTTVGLFGDDMPPAAWKNFTPTLATNLWHYGARVAGAVIRRTPGLRTMAPRGRWFDIHADLPPAKPTTVSALG
jgi:hypothetical protein